MAAAIAAAISAAIAAAIAAAIDLLEAATPTLVGVVGFALAELWRWRRNRRERFGRLLALRAEISSCRATLEGFHAANPVVLAPLYRLPTWGAMIALPQLIGDGTLSENSARALMNYYTHIEEVNRGLDRAGAFEVGNLDPHAEENEPLRQEYSRNLLRAGKLLQQLQEIAEQAIGEELRKHRWLYRRLRRSSVRATTRDGE
jgi:hypothetical protein